MLRQTACHNNTGNFLQAKPGPWIYAALAGTSGEDISRIGDALDTVSTRPDFTLLVSPVIDIIAPAATDRSVDPQKLLVFYRVLLEKKIISALIFAGNEFLTTTNSK